MPELKAASVEEAQAEFNRQIEMRAAIAFACDCRLAVTTISEAGPLRLGGLGPGYSPDGQITITWQFVVLSPGESPPDGFRWTIYEQRNGQAVGRSA